MVRGRVTFEGRSHAHGCSWDIKQGRGRRTSAATAASFLAARTRLSERGPCFAQNFLAAGVSTVPSSTMMLPFVSIRIAQLIASAALSCSMAVAGPPAAAAAS